MSSSLTDHQQAAIIEKMKQLKDYSDKDITDEHFRRMAEKNDVFIKSEEVARQQKVSLLVKELTRQLQIPVYMFMPQQFEFYSTMWSDLDSSREGTWQSLGLYHKFYKKFRGYDVVALMVGIMRQRNKEHKRNDKTTNEALVIYGYNINDGSCDSDELNEISYCIREIGKLRVCGQPIT